MFSSYFDISDGKLLFCQTFPWGDALPRGCLWAGLRAVTQLKGLGRRIVFYPRGPVPRTQDGINVLPLSDFAEMLAAGELWEGM